MVNCHVLVHFLPVIVQFPARLLGYVGSQRADLLCTTKYDIKPDDAVMIA